MKFSFLSLVICFVFANVSLFPQTTPPISTELAAEVGKEISALPGLKTGRVGILAFLIPSDFTDIPVDPVLEYLSRYLPRILVSRIPDVPNRILTDSEQKGIVTGAIDRVTGRLIQSYSDQQRQKSQAFLRSSNFSLTGNREILARESRDLFNLSRNEAGTEVFFDQLPREIPLALSLEDPAPKPGDRFVQNYISPGEILDTRDQGMIPDQLEYKRFIQNLHTASQNVDYLVFGRIRELGLDSGLVYVEYGVYSRFNKTIILSGQFSPPRSEAGERAQDEAFFLAESLSREDRSGFSVLTLPPVYEIWVDEQLRGEGLVGFDTWSQGPIDIQIRLGEQTVYHNRYILDSKEPRDFVIPLDPPPQWIVVLNSEPSGAKVLADGIPLGYTPVTVSLGQLTSVVEFQKEGYHKRRVVLDDTFRQQGMDVVLLDGRIDWSARVEDGRDRFYAALGITAVSVAIPLVLNGMFNNAAEVAFQTSDPNLSRRANTLYFLRNGGWVLAGTSIAHTLFELRNYMRAAQTAVTR